MTAGSAKPSSCAICGPDQSATERFPSTIDGRAFTAAIFSARRVPDRVHGRIVACDGCGLVRTDPVVGAEQVEALYRASSFDYGAEVRNLQRTYGRYLARVEALGGAKRALLEIGCGSGFFLETALDRGYARVLGVEPSLDAASRASPRVRPFIVSDVFRPGQIEACSVDVICMFQVFDHLLDPGRMLDECLRLLEPGGLLLCFNHNVESLSMRVLGERSPIVDIEHPYLYAPRTMSMMLTNHGFSVRRIGAAWNDYSLGYLAHLAPLPSGLKRTVSRLLSLGRLDRVRLRAPLGNLYAIAQKPDV